MSKTMASSSQADRGNITELEEKEIREIFNLVDVDGFVCAWRVASASGLCFVCVIVCKCMLVRVVRAIERTVPTELQQHTHASKTLWHRSGSICKEELFQLMRCLGINASTQEIDLMMIEIDENQDDEIQFEGMFAVRTCKGRRCERRASYTTA